MSRSSSSSLSLLLKGMRQMATATSTTVGGRMAQSEILSAPAAAPVASSSLPEARLRARRLFREVCTRM